MGFSDFIASCFGSESAMSSKERRRKERRDKHRREDRNRDAQQRAYHDASKLAGQVDKPLPRRPIADRQSVRTPRSPPVAVLPSKKHMTPQVCLQVVALIDRLFPHIPYAVNGLAAMLLHGFRARLPTQVTIVCPSHTELTVETWAVTQGMQRIPGQRNVYAIATVDGILRSVKIKFVDEGYEDYGIIRCRTTEARVLNLRTIADEIARGYIQNLEKDSKGSKKKQKVFYGDMNWVLHMLIRFPSYDTALTNRHCTHIYSQNFWLPFTMSYPNTIRLFETAGVDTRSLEMEATYGGSNEAPVSIRRSSGSKNDSDWTLTEGRSHKRSSRKRH